MTSFPLRRKKMTNKDFLEEIIEYDKERYAFFEKYQAISYDLLKVFHNLCIENGLTYYLAYGTLLGAYRGDGMIPWDCDVDIAVPYSEIDKLYECLKTKLPKGYYFVSERTNDDYPYYLLRICKEGYDDGIHVDAFYMYGLPDDKKKQEKICKKVKDLYYWRKIKIGTMSENKKKLRKAAKRFLGAFISLKRMNRKLDNICTRYPIETSKYLAFVSAKSFPIPSEMFGKPSLIKVGDSEFMAPQDPETFLELRYGNWKEYMPIKIRYKEFETLYNFLLGVEAKHNNK